MRGQIEKLDCKIKNEIFLQRTIQRCKEKNIVLPKFSELKDPETISPEIKEKQKLIGMDEVHPLNLFRINWQNDHVNGGIGLINLFEIPGEILGVKARIIF